MDPGSSCVKNSFQTFLCEKLISKILPKKYLKRGLIEITTNLFKLRVKERRNHFRLT